jgi:hypothetical protein
MTYQDKLDKFTFLIPIFNLKDERLENFKFVLSKIKEVTDNILVVEQVINKKECSEAYEFTKSIGVEYLSVKIDDKHIHKSKIINVGTEKIKTEFVWVNDSDCYLKFKKVIEQLDLRHNFIQPYNVAKYIEKEDTDKIINNEPVNIEFNYSKLHETGQHIVPGTLYYVAMYGALSFICRKYAFKKIGAMNEKYTGWGLEDNSLCMRMFMSGPKFDIINQAGIHLYHPRGNYKEKLECSRTLNNIKVYEEEFGGIYTDLHQHLRDYYTSAFNEKLLILGIERSGTNLLLHSICKINMLIPYGEPFHTNGIRDRTYLNFENFNLDKYLKFFTDKHNCCIKHLDTQSECASVFNISQEEYRLKIKKELIKHSARVIITTRFNFIDWFISFVLSWTENNWQNKEYQTTLKVKIEEFNHFYQIWYTYHYIHLPESINMLKMYNKKYKTVDYDNLCDKNGNFFDIDLNITYKDIFNNAINRKQKIKNNSQYISNYDELLSWYNEKNI